MKLRKAGDVVAMILITTYAVACLLMFLALMPIIGVASIFVEDNLFDCVIEKMQSGEEFIARITKYNYD